MKSAIEIRKWMKKRKPDFIRRDAHKKVKVGKKWRKPTGHHNKFVRHCNGTFKKLEVGYKSPKDIRGANKQGIFEVLVSNIKDISKIVNKNQGIVIKRTTGTKKKIEIIKHAKEKGIKVLNIKDTEEFIKKSQKTKKEKESKEKKTETKEEKVSKDKEVIKTVKKTENEEKSAAKTEKIVEAKKQNKE